ncbi:MAG: pterin-4a-carbinolamine dehydratase [Planctomycetota bacterium]|jgi:pterin-4a-carbinolamine dehydratase
MPAVTRVADAVVDEALRSLPGWGRVSSELRCRYALPSFVDAVTFTTRIAAVAEELQHHPEWTVTYTTVALSMTTHDAGGLSQRDVDLARRIVAIAEELSATPVAGDRVLARDHTWVPPGYFYSPIVDVSEAMADADKLFAPGLHEMAEVDLRVAAQVELVRQLACFYGEEDFPVEKRDGRRYCLNNEYFPYGDAFAYFSLLRHLKPKRVIEVGAGWSSAVLLDTDEGFLGESIDCTFIDPYPDRLLSLMTESDQARTRILQRRLQDVDMSEFERLEDGDMLFIDSSHIAKTGSDVLHAVFKILPALADGVWVHFHDIHANFEYPREWVEEGRSWNENYLMRAFLMHNHEWCIELHAATLAECAAAKLLPLGPAVGQAVGGSLWLRKVGGMS